MKNAENDDFIFVITATLICFALAFLIYRLFRRNKKGEKFSFSDFRTALIASLGIMLIVGFIYMSIKLINP